MIAWLRENYRVLLLFILGAYLIFTVQWATGVWDFEDKPSPCTIVVTHVDPETKIITGLLSCDSLDFDKDKDTELEDVDPTKLKGTTSA